MFTNTQLKWMVVGLLVVGALYILAPILTPFLVGALLAYLVNPLVNRCMRCHLPRLFSVIIVFVVVFGILVSGIIFLIPVIQKQIFVLGLFIPKVIAWGEDSLLPWISRLVGSEVVINIGVIKTVLADNWMKAGDVMTWFLKTLLHSGYAFITGMVNIILIPVVTFYLLCDWNKLIQLLDDALPRSIEPTIAALVSECDDVLSAFLRGQLMVMLSLSVLYAVGLSWVGLQIGVILGIIIGFISIIPYLGVIVGVTVASIAGIVQWGHLMPLIFIWGVFLVGHFTESLLLTPYLVGDRIGLHPVAVIFAILAGGHLFGFFGVLLALPVAAVLMVWLRFLNQRYRASDYYQ